MFQGLQKIRTFVKGQKLLTPGLADKYLKSFETDSVLQTAVKNAVSSHQRFQEQYSAEMQSSEAALIDKTQEWLLNFYDKTSVNKYVALNGQGPWVVTSHGAVIYEVGGYGMLGFGHNPPSVLKALSSSQIMANIMTPNMSQVQFSDALTKEIGHSRGGKCPYESFICLNSGSECVGLAMRIMDRDAQLMTAKTGPHPDWTPVLVSLRGSFHGRTDRPAMASDSSQATYRTYLRSFKSSQLNTVIPNDVAHLRAVFDELTSKKMHVEGMLLEPVMGEGNPGLSITREFYDEARRLTDKYRSTLLVDSIQAGFRASGCLSITDYPGFQDAAPPDFETFSKAISGGQFPLSVLALGPRVPDIYVQGLYGNTMTSNPRALDVACAVLKEFTPELRENIRAQGLNFKKMLERLQHKHTDAIERVSGTGLLVAAHFNPGWRAFGNDSLEQITRRMGVGVIHGGKNALRFTPTFTITPAEIDLVGEVLDDAINEYRTSFKDAHVAEHKAKEEKKP